MSSACHEVTSGLTRPPHSKAPLRFPAQRGFSLLAYGSRLLGQNPTCQGGGLVLRQLRVRGHGHRAPRTPASRDDFLLQESCRIGRAVVSACNLDKSRPHALSRGLMAGEAVAVLRQRSGRAHRGAYGETCRKAGAGDGGDNLKVPGAHRGAVGEGCPSYRE